MTIRPSVSMPPVTGDYCGEPSDLLVISTMLCLGRTKSSNASRSTVVVVAMVRANVGPSSGRPDNSIKTVQ